MEAFTIGLDFGTLSVRAVLMNVANGKIYASSTCSYSHGVITERLPNTHIALPDLWCLQDPNDYLEGMIHAVRQVVDTGIDQGITKRQIAGIGVDFTCCTVLPVYQDGTPLVNTKKWHTHPHAWVKLWKHHAAQEQADKINRIAEIRKEKWLDYYGGKVSSEWFFPKLLQLFEEAPDVYEEMDTFIEAGDWIVWQLTDHEMRNESSAGYKAMYQKKLGGFPTEAFFAALEPGFANVVQEKIDTVFYPPGTSAGCITKKMAEKLNLDPTTIVTVNNIDAHVCTAAANISNENKMLSIIGTSSCDIVLSKLLTPIPGSAGLVQNGAIEHFAAYETGQNAVGDMLAWFVQQHVPLEYHQQAQKANLTIYQWLEKKARTILPGSSGLIALDWWNGSRSPLMDADLSGLILGFSLQTKPEEIYRALIEAAAFGKKMIIDNFEEYGQAIDQLVFCGGLPYKNKLLNQIYADITQKTVYVSSELETAAKSAAIFASVAIGESRGGYLSIAAAQQKTAADFSEKYVPDPAASSVYDQLYQVYKKLTTTFSQSQSEMKQLQIIKRKVKG